MSECLVLHTEIPEQLGNTIFVKEEKIAAAIPPEIAPNRPITMLFEDSDNEQLERSAYLKLVGPSSGVCALIGSGVMRPIGSPNFHTEAGRKATQEEIFTEMTRITEDLPDIRVNLLGIMLNTFVEKLDKTKKSETIDISPYDISAYTTGEVVRIIAALSIFEKLESEGIPQELRELYAKEYQKCNTTITTSDILIRTCSLASIGFWSNHFTSSPLLPIGGLLGGLGLSVHYNVTGNGRPQERKVKSIFKKISKTINEYTDPIETAIETAKNEAPLPIFIKSTMRADFGPRGRKKAAKESKLLKPKPLLIPGLT